MKRSTSSAQLKELPSLPPALPDIPNIIEGSSVQLPLMKKKLFSKKSNWSVNTADFFVLSCSFLITISTVFIALIFCTQRSWSFSPILGKALSILQRVIASLSLSITSAVIMVAGKQYVLFKLARGGLNSRGVAVYSNASIGGLAGHLTSHGVELPLLGFLIVWGLALATGLTVDKSWEMGPASEVLTVTVPSGPLVPAAPGSSWPSPASEQLYLVMSLLCEPGTAGTAGLINITGGELTSGYPPEIVYYPPLPSWFGNIGFSFSTPMNGFSTSAERLSSVPSTARNITCAQESLMPLNYWLDGSGDQTLSIIVADQNDTNPIRFNATPIIMGGTLSSSGSHVEFALNGTSWPNVMPPDSQWAQDIANLICNTTTPYLGACGGWSFPDFANLLNTNFTQPSDSDWPLYWSTISNMVLGAYGSAIYLNISATNPGASAGHNGILTAATLYNAQVTPRYGVYILIVNVATSAIMLIVVAKLRLASDLGPDFINLTRLLLGPLKQPELFNASLTETIDTR